MNKHSIPSGHTFDDYYIIFKRARSEDTLKVMVNKQLREVEKKFANDPNVSIDQIKVEIWRAEDQRQTDFTTNKHAVDAQIELLNRNKPVESAKYDPQKEFAKALSALSNNH
ncbi:TPA: hypothetical protein RQN23_003785 [Aeromonas veronii]|nr:hypothetical protein [Aeromonas veronii]